MKITHSEFVTSALDIDKCPQLHLPEFALVGRSNVGKSSFINCMINRKKLAHTSNTPGKTRTINFYNISGLFVFVDLPGYGYAKVSKTMQKAWKEKLEKFLLNRQELVAVFQIIDSRIPVQDNDIMMREWLNFNHIKTFTILTKADSTNQKDLKKHAQLITETFNAEPIIFSSKDSKGKEKVHSLLSESLVVNPIR